MGENLDNLLDQENPSALPRIERALLSQDDLSADQEAVLSALIWQRCTSGGSRLLGCVLNPDCAARIEALPDQLAHIGAKEAALATRELLSVIPFDCDEIRGGLVDWVDTQPEIINKSRELDNGLTGIEQTIWDFMKDSASDIPDLAIPTRTQSIITSLTTLFRSGGNDPA